MDRRKFIKAGAAGTVVSSVAIAAKSNPIATPPETEGPFYPIVAQDDKDFDLTQIEGHTSAAKGKHIYVQGKVVDMDNNPVAGVTVDIWQCNAAGRYAHPHDKNPAPLDPDFQGWGIMATNDNGEFNFKTVYPGAYGVNDEWSRPPHIHYKVSKRGYAELTTQMYFPDEPLNDVDSLILKKSPEERKMMISTLSRSKADTYEYTIVLDKV